MDILPPYNKSSVEYVNDVANQNARNTQEQQPVLDPQADETFGTWKEERVNHHRDNFPLGDNLYTLIFYRHQ